MAAPIMNDRKLGAEVRRMTLNKIKDILGDDEHKKYDEKFQREVLLKLATNALPRLNEHSGEDGGAIIINVSREGAEKYGITPGSSADTIGQASV